MKGLVHEASVGASVEWYTPPWLFERLGLTFDLDPCAPPGGLPWIPARQFYSRPDDGLVLPWQGCVWCNPPYGRETGRWMDAMQAHGHGVGLVFARTDTEWFQRLRPDAVCFIAKRVRFVDASGRPPQVLDKKTGRLRDGTPGAPSMLLAWGRDCVRAVEASGLGIVMGVAW